MSTINKLYKNVGASVLPQIINIISSFILPVLIIDIYGSQMNGLISTIKGLIAYISLVGAGIATATTQALYKPVAMGDNLVVQGMLKATSDMFNRCGLIFLIVVVVVSLIYPFTIVGDISYTTTVLLLIVMSISGVSEFFIVGRCRSLLYADQKVYVCTTIQAISLTVSLVLAVIMLYLNANIVFVQFAVSLVYIVRAFLLSYYVKKNYPQYIFTKETTPIKSAVKKRNDAMIHQLSGLLVFSSQSIILSIMVGLEAASIYAVYNIVFSGLFAICSNMNTAVTPFLGRSFAVSELLKVRKEFNVVELVYYLLVTLVFSITAVVILPFISIYTREADINYMYPTFGLLFTVLQVFNVFRLPHSAMINVAGHFKETRFRAIIESIICIVCSVFFTFLYGMYGVLIGTALAIAWRCIDMIFYVHKHVLKDVWIFSLFRLIRSLLIIAILFIIVPQPVTPLEGYINWMGYVGVVTICSIVLIAVDLLLFDRDTFRSLFRYIRKK